MLLLARDQYKRTADILGLGLHSTPNFDHSHTHATVPHHLDDFIRGVLPALLLHQRLLFPQALAWDQPARDQQTSSEVPEHLKMDVLVGQ